MSLASQSWNPISIHTVVAEFLLGERFKVAQFLPHDKMGVVDNADTDNPFDNHFRLRLLFYFRCQLFCEIPPDTVWFEVHSLGDEDLADLRVIGRCGWDDPGDNNEITKVANRKPGVLSGPPATWRKPILWGHDKNGPFTIMEGNNRLTAYVAAGGSHELHVPVLVGLSPTPCFFHTPDPPRMLANDLWKANWHPFWH